MFEKNSIYFIPFIGIVFIHIYHKKIDE